MSRIPGRPRFGVLLLTGAALVAACSDPLLDPAGPDQPVVLGLSVAPSAAVAGMTPDAFARTDAAHVRVSGAAASPAVLDTVVASSGAGDRSFALPVRLPSATGTYQLQVQLTSQGRALFQGAVPVQLRRGYHENVQLTLTPIVAGLVAPDSLPTFTALGDSARALAAAVFASGDTVTGLLPTWSDDGSGVVHASADGLVTAAREGVGRITASYQGFSATTRVRVQAAVAGIVLAPDSTTIFVDSSRALAPTARDRHGNALVRSFVWQSSSPTVATVDSTGLVHALAPGRALISASAGGQVGSAVVLVRPVPVASLALRPDSAFLLPGDSRRIVATPLDASGNVLGGRLITWLSRNPAVATVDTSGLVSAVAAGIDTIVATSEGQSASAIINVIRPVLGLGVTRLTFSAVAGQGDPASQNVAVDNAGSGGALAGLATNVSYAAGQPAGWLATALAAATTPTGLTVQPHVAGLAVGSYDATVTVSSTTRGTTAAVVSVTLNLTAPAPPPPPPTGPSVRITPRTLTLPVDVQRQLSAAVLDASGAPIAGAVTWTSLDSGIVSVTQTGLITTLAAGTGRVVAAAAGRADTATVTVTATPALVRITPHAPTIAVGGQQPLIAAVLDGTGAALPYVAAWTSLDPTIAAVSQAGVVTGLAAGSARVVAAAQGLADTATVTVTAATNPVAAVQIVPHTAYVAVNGQQQLTATATNAFGAVLPATITWTSLDPGIVSVTQAGLVTGIAAGTGHVAAAAGGHADTATVIVTGAGVTSWALVRSGALSLSACGLTAAGAGYCWGRIPFTSQPGAGVIPTPVPGSATFTDIVGGVVHGCGVTVSGAALCWGDNTRGQLGDGAAEPSSSSPVTVAGGLAFRTVSVGAAFSCGLTTAGAAYCWGRNDFGQLGSGVAASSTVPVLVVGGLTFTAISTGAEHTCALTAAGQAYCWGRGSSGELGRDSVSRSSTPLPVSGGLTFRSIAAGNHGTCATTSAGAVYCWGKSPALGISSPVPVPASATALQQVAVDSVNACGVDGAGLVQCAGANDLGQLGDGGTTPRTTLAPVSGSATFTSVTVGQTFACGLTSGGRILCWGSNAQNQLGTGSGSSSLVPVLIADPGP